MDSLRKLVDALGNPQVLDFSQYMITNANISKLCKQWDTSFCCHANATTTIDTKDAFASTRESKAAVQCPALLVT